MIRETYHTYKSYDMPNICKYFRHIPYPSLLYAFHGTPVTSVSGSVRKVYALVQKKSAPVCIEGFDSLGFAWPK